MIGSILSPTMMIIDAIGPAWSKLFLRRARKACATTKRGISVLIPERANPLLLGKCLDSVWLALGQLSEPVEVIVVVSASAPPQYDHLHKRYPAVRWLFFNKPLWFGRAICEGLKIACYDWVYLLNSDMTVDSQALSEVLPWRAPHVFAIASQIFLADRSLRREETGWTRFMGTEDRMEIHDTPPEDEFVRGTLYAGGGASLFQKRLLIRFAASSSAYEPFYWEDVEWGTVAWRCGFESLFCPKSKVQHHRRATNRLIFPESEIDRIFQRNRIQYQFRNSLHGPDSRAMLFQSLYWLDRRSLREILTLHGLASMLWSRIKYWAYPFRELPLQHAWRKYYLQPWPVAEQKPRIIIVTPYAIYPPAHGGAVRLHKLIEAISARFSVILLSDEGDRYSRDSLKYFERLFSVHLMTGRPDDGGGGRIQRINSHSRPDLKVTLKMLLACHDPSLVQVEYIELAKLAEVRESSIPWLLTLHESWISGKSAPVSEEDRYESALINEFDAVITCSEEDAQPLNHPAVHVVSNGAEVRTTSYVPSPESGPILFMGPFRYLPNLNGIRDFLEFVYPRLLARIPDLRLWVLGGFGARETAAQLACFNQKGVSVLDYVEQPRPLLDQSSITINPLRAVRGSCLKVAESIVAGRVCVSTTEGARGFLGHKASAVVAVDTVGEFEEPIWRLLCDMPHRRFLERPSDQILREFSWEKSAGSLAAIYASMMESRGLCHGEAHVRRCR
jgi:GT2 family glycosyltransferase/glycosyltransferase involved in cell wall biosynthesis